MRYTDLLPDTRRSIEQGLLFLIVLGVIGLAIGIAIHKDTVREEEHDRDQRDRLGFVCLELHLPGSPVDYLRTAPVSDLCKILKTDDGPLAYASAVETEADAGFRVTCRCSGVTP